MKLSRLARQVLLCASILSFSSCYSLTVQSSAEVPVSLSRSTGSEKKTQKHFSRQVYQWYILGLVPYDFWNDLFPDTKGLKSQQFVDFVVQEEAAGSGGVTNLNVVTERSVTSWLLSLLVSLIPVAGPIVNGNMSVTIEGDVLEP